jgi:hypothetical protein
MAAFSQMRETLKRIPVVAPCLRAIRRTVLPPPAFKSSDDYWKARYREDRTSGPGSYGRLARFKADVLNHFVRSQRIASVMEWGCGDGNQLELAEYPSYVGVDISPDALAMCRRKFTRDATKQFVLYPDVAKNTTAELALSLDVIFHLVEDPVFDAYMRALTASATRFIGIYSSDREEPGHMAHVRHRAYSQWMAVNAPEWNNFEHIENRYTFDPSNPDETSFADFRFFRR